MPRVEDLHTWDLTTAEARDLQLRLAASVQTTEQFISVEHGSRCRRLVRSAWQVVVTPPSLCCVSAHGR